MFPAKANAPQSDKKGEAFMILLTTFPFPFDLFGRSYLFQIAAHFFSSFSIFVHIASSLFSGRRLLLQKLIQYEIVFCGEKFVISFSGVIGVFFAEKVIFQRSEKIFISLVTFDYRKS